MALATEKTEPPSAENDRHENNHGSSWLFAAAKFGVAIFFISSAVNILRPQEEASSTATSTLSDHKHRRLEASPGPSFMDPLFEDLKSRHKLFDETPVEEHKYWFEYDYPVEKYHYRYSRSRKKTDYFEGRDDSGIVSSRFIADAGGNQEYRDFYLKGDDVPVDEKSQHLRLLELCKALGHPSRSMDSAWKDLYGSKPNLSGTTDRCRVLFAMNTVGAGRGTTLLWETRPPVLHAEEPRPWISEQETAMTHLERNLQEIDAMCKTGLIAARVQVLVCEPIPDVWTEWMDSQLVNCGGKPWPQDLDVKDTVKLEDRASPIQVVVAGSPSTADTCHDLNSGFMEKRVQDLLLAPPYLDSKQTSRDSATKTTNPNLFSSENYDVYVGFKWSSLVTLRAVQGFVQASADLAAASSLPRSKDTSVQGPATGFLVPSFVRFSYVSEENNKVAKWRMHGDFFHPAAWEINSDSFEVTWIPGALAGEKGTAPICDATVSPATNKKFGEDCGQYWVYMTESQMPTSPEVFANEITPAPVMGGSNFIWMVTEQHRRKMVDSLVCRHDNSENCPDEPLAAIPLGDLESFQINYTPNTALGKQHVKDRRPGYSHMEEREQERERVRERKQLHDNEDIEEALFDYNIYTSALFRKDATLKAVRARDTVLTKDHNPELLGPQTIKSDYYDVTITKPRTPVLGWCQRIARRGLCGLFSDYFRTGEDGRCSEACGLKRDFTPVSAAAATE